MIITNFNEMSLEDLYVINSALGMEFEINDGIIIRAVNGGVKNEQN